MDVFVALRLEWIRGWQSSVLSVWQYGGIHGLDCKYVPSRVVRHHALNDCNSRAFSPAGIPVKTEQAGLVRSDGKQPEGCTLIPWHVGKPLAWAVTVCTTTTASHTAGAAADKKCTNTL